MDKINIFPLIQEPDDETLKNINQLTKKELRKFRKTNLYKETVKPVLDRESQYKKEKRISWFMSYGLSIINTILALIAAITGIISLLLQLS